MLSRRTSFLAVAFLLALLLGGLFIAETKAADKVIHVFLVGGQSNADGRADPAELPTQPVNLQEPQADVPFFASGIKGVGTLRPMTGSPRGQFGPEISFGRSMADFYKAKAGEGAGSIAIVKYAAGGTNLFVQWAAGGDATQTADGVNYVKFQNQVNAGLAELRKAFPGSTVEVSGMIWMQGESDAVPPVDGVDVASNYGSNLTALIKDVRLTYGANLPFVIGRLSAAQTGVGKQPYRDYVRRGQERASRMDAHTALVDTDTFALKQDNGHFNAAGQMALGEAFAKRMQGLLVTAPTAAAARK